MEKANLKSIVWKESGQYVALCLNVDVSSFGETKGKALANLNEALELYFEDQNDADIHEVTEPEIVSSTLDNA